MNKNYTVLFFEQEYCCLNRLQTKLWSDPEQNVLLLQFESYSKTLPFLSTLKKILQLFHDICFLFFFRAGDISLLSVDAIVNSSNESMSERNPISDRICARAGPALREEIRQDVKGVLGVWLITCL
jgi:hypothetical protein